MATAPKVFLPSRGVNLEWIGQLELLEVNDPPVPLPGATVKRVWTPDNRLVIRDAASTDKTGCGRNESLLKMQPPITQLLGLDLSPNHTGWCFCEIASPGHLTYGVHDLEKSALGELEKMDFILEWLKPRLRPDLLVMIENFAFCAQGKAVLQLAGLQYLVRHQLFKSGTPFRLISPNQAKKFLTGRHNSGKDVILKEVLKRYRIDVDDHNVADAINFNRIGQALLGWIEPDNQAQRAVVEELLKGESPRKKRLKKTIGGRPANERESPRP